MGERAEKAEAYFKQGYNCAQSVVLAFADKMGIEPVQALKISSPFGGGMGRMREVCGTVSGMLMVLGSIDGYDDPKNAEAKVELYARVQQMANEFKIENGSIVCKELLGLPGADAPKPADRTSEYYKKRPCGILVRIAAEIVERHIK